MRRRQFEIAVSFGRSAASNSGRRWRVRAIFFSLLAVALVDGSLGLGCACYTSPAYAGDDDEDRQEAQRQRAEAQRRREEAQRQREEAQRQREEAQRQRQEAQRQRQEAQAQAREQRAAERQERREERSSSRDNPSDTRSSPSDTRSSQSNSGDSQRDSATNDHSASDDGSDTASRSGGSKDANSKQTASGDGTSKNGKQNTNSNKDNGNKEKSDDADASDDDGVAPIEPEVQPPRTLVEWWKNVVGNTSDSSKSPPPVTKNTPRGNGEDSRTQDQAQVAGGAADSKKAGPPQNQAVPGARASAASYNGVKVGGFDKGLLDMGVMRKRQILVSGLDASSAEKATAMGFKTVATGKSPASSLPVLLLSVPQGISEDAAQRRLAEVFPSGHFGPNHVYRIYPATEEAKSSSAGTNAPQTCAGPECFAKELIRWDKPLSACAERVRIGVIDTSFDISHPAFADRKFGPPADFRTRAMSFKDDWHGTAVLSILAGGEHSSTPGLVPGAEFFLASTFGADNNGAASADALAVLSALAWLDRNNVDIVNMSFSGPSNGEIEAAIRSMAAKGVIFVAAGGNQGAYGAPSYPAAYPQVIAVTAVRRDTQSYAHATHGDYIDLAAPGVDVYTALPLGQAGLRTGTSFAAPFVTALVAAMPGARKGIRDKYDLLARISKNDLGAPGRDPTFGEGLPIAPKSCDEIGGVASLPWTPEAKRLQQQPDRPVVEGTSAPTVTGSLSSRNSVPAGSAMGSAFGFAP